MFQHLTFSNFKKQEARIMCLVTGALYILLGTFIIVGTMIQRKMFSKFEMIETHLILNAINHLHGIWMKVMPLMVLLGIGYIIFGLLLSKVKRISFQINLVLSMFSLIWVIIYITSLLNNIDEFIAPFTSEFEQIKFVLFVFAGFGLLMILAMFTIPQYLIGKRIYISRQQVY